MKYKFKIYSEKTHEKQVSYDDRDNVMIDHNVNNF